jgi:hypothetical protein
MILPSVFARTALVAVLTAFLVTGVLALTKPTIHTTTYFPVHSPYPGYVTCGRVETCLSFALMLSLAVSNPTHKFRAQGEGSARARTIGKPSFRRIPRSSSSCDLCSFAVRFLGASRSSSGRRERLARLRAGNTPALNNAPAGAAERARCHADCCNDG